MKINKLLIIFAIFLNGTLAIAQQPNAIKFNSPIPPSPTAAALAKYGDIPVAAYTGIPTIGIPIYEIQSTLEPLNISLSYHAKGFKISEESSNVGLGWSLNAGGVITRVKKMNDDLSEKGYYKSNIHTNNDGTDKEPDVFYFNFSNFSGKFLIDYSADPSNPYVIKKIGTYDDEDLKIILNSNNTWQIIDKSGTKFEFNAMESQSDNTTTVGLYKSDLETSDYISSWFLTKIIYTNGDEIVLNYNQGVQLQNIPIINQVYRITTAYVSTIPFNCYVPPATKTELSTTTHNVKVNTIDLIDITFPGGKIEFKYNADRIDLRTTKGHANRLVGIDILNKLETGYNVFKSFALDQSYFNSSSGEDYLTKRLKLDRFSEIGITTGEKLDHTFTYFNDVLPNKDSKNIDHWGYYNGPKNNQTWVPSNANGSPDPNGSTRFPDADFVKANLLSQIIYPNQLRTYFDYEINDFSNLGMAIGWSSQSDFGRGMKGSGVRIKSIVNSDSDITNPILKREFEYLINGANKSSGQIMSTVNYRTFYDNYFPVNLFGSCQSYSSLVREKGELFYSNSSVPLSGDAQGNIIGYDQVVIKNIGNSEVTKTAEEYHNFSSSSNDLLSKMPTINNNMNGLLKRRTDYLTNGSTDVPLHQTELSYSTQSSDIIKGYIYQSNGSGNSLSLLNYDVKCDWIVKIKSITKDFDLNLNTNVGSVTNYIYDDNNKQKVQEITTDSQGDIYTTVSLYPKNMTAWGKIYPYQEMVNRHMSGVLIETQNYKNSTLLEKVTTEYATGWPNNTSLILPSVVKTQYKENDPKVRMTYENYDKKGNLLTVSYIGGIKTSFLWSQDSHDLIAEIKNADFATIQSVLTPGKIDYIAKLASIDKKGIDDFLAPLVVALPNIMISKFETKPLIGLVSQTDPKGMTTSFGYDDFGRLKWIKDHNGNVKNENIYHYKK